MIEESHSVANNIRLTFEVNLEGRSHDNERSFSSEHKIPFFN